MRVGCITAYTDSDTAGVLVWAGASFRHRAGGHIGLARRRASGTGNKVVTREARDAKMTPKVQQIYGAEISVEGDQIEILGRRDQHHHARHIHVSKINP